MKHKLLGIILGAAMLIAAPFSHATFLHYGAFLSGPNEAPPNLSPGTGFADVFIDTVAHTMHVVVDFAGLTGTTTASHIHCCTAVPLAGTAGVATQTPSFAGFPLGVTAGTYDHTFDMTLASSYNPSYITANGGTPLSAEAALFAGIAAGRSYYNIHSSVFGGGEIRGFLVQIPEPGTIALLASGLGAGWAMRRRRRT